MHRFILLFVSFTLLFVGSSFGADKKPKKTKKKKVDVSLLSVSLKLNELKADEGFYAVSTSTSIPERWLPLMMSVREARIARQDAIDSMKNFTNNLWDFLESRVEANKIKKYSDDEWVFPVRGYTPGAIGGHNGSGYVPAGFDFFEKNSGGHPAHDIFIDDGDQNSLDDGTGEPVEILSMSGGIVVETRKIWEPSMTDIRGGNIVYVYDNFSNGFFYYAHLKDVSVNVGDFVKPGTSLGTMGRTGKNAYPSRSPTHLHIMYVRCFDGDIRPENIYNDLLKAKLIP